MIKHIENVRNTMYGIPLMTSRFLKNLVDTEKTEGKKKRA